MRLALFDLDKTLLPIDSDHAWGEYTVSLGWRDADTFTAANNRFYQQYEEQSLDLNEYMRFATAAFREQGRERAGTAREQYVRQIIRPAVLPQALELVEKARQSADEVLLITATNEFVAEPIAPLFGINHCIAVELEEAADVPGAADGEQWFSGNIKGIPSFREGKCQRLLAWLAARGKSWDDISHSVFYSDSINDLPLLEMVHEPVATNPDDSLRKLAQERGWEILQLWQQ